ncbi:hypothetical protein ONK27_26130, partial [Salmonella enterica subsp. enterica serovar Virginia]|nr:hypothetical protein [Salmonella enterica subsp. enterica serovar Virginia]
LTVLIAASAMQGMGTGVGGVMARTLPRDLYEGTQLRHANSLLYMAQNREFFAAWLQKLPQWRQTTTPFLFLHTPDIAQAPELVNT